MAVVGMFLCVCVRAARAGGAGAEPYMVQAGQTTVPQYCECQREARLELHPPGGRGLVLEVSTDGGVSGWGGALRCHGGILQGMYGTPGLTVRYIRIMRGYSGHKALGSVVQ